MSHRTYRFRGFDREGRRTAGTVTAASLDDARHQVMTSVRFIEDVRLSSWPSIGRTVPATELASGLRVLATLLASGLSLNRVLGIYEDLAPRAWRRAWPAVRASVRHGKSLSEALRDSELRLPGDLMGIMAAGDSGAGLSKALARAAVVAEAQVRTRNAIHAALAYPMLLLTVGTATMLVLLTTVLPRFAAIVEDLGQVLPPATRLLITAGELARLVVPPLVAVLALAILAGRAWLETGAGRAWWHALLLRLPGIGPLRLSAATSTNAATLAALLEGGVPLAAALNQLAAASGDHAVAVRLSHARAAVVRGESLAGSLLSAGAMTAGAARCTRAGEESGRLIEMLRHAGDLETELLERRLKHVTRLLEPALILFFGLATAGVAVALLQAVYAVRPQ